jgi:hypothetical protein
MSKATFEGLKARNKALNKFVHSLSRVRDDYEDSEWQRGYNFAEIEIGNKLRQLMGSLPPGYNRGVPSLKTQAKERFLQWKRNQAQAEWKKLPEAEQKRWEAYVAEGVDFGEIREREIKRAEDFQVGDFVSLHHNIGYQGSFYPSGSEGTIVGMSYDEVHEEDTFMVVFQNQQLLPMNARAFELRKVL